MNEEKLPFIENLENTFIAGFMQDRKMWVRMYQHIELNYFRDKDISKIFQILKVYFDKYHDFPTLEICINLADKKKYEVSVIEKLKNIFDIKNTLQLHEINYLYDECNRFIREQKIKNAIITSIDLLEQQKFDLIEERVRDAIQWNNDIDLGMQINEADERYRLLEALNKERIPWPWPRLNILNPGMLKKQLYIIVSSSSVGKSIFLDNVAFYTWHTLKKNVVSITLEISELIKCKRMDAYGLEMPMTLLEDNKKDVIRFYENTKLENRLFVKEFPTASATVKQDFYSYLYNLELYAGLKKEDIDLIVVDYAGITKPSNVTGNMYLDGGAVCEDLRAMAQQYDVPVITADQLNRCTFIDTIVQMQKGKIKIKDIQIGDKILSDNGYNTVVDKTPITKKKVYKIKTKSGKEIICSANHVFPTNSGEKSINTGLSIGDKLFAADEKSI